MPSYTAKIIPRTNIPNGHTREHCIAHHTQITTIGRDIGQQVRVKRVAPDGVTLLGYALYTVIAVHDQKPEAVFLGYKNLADLNERLGLSDADHFVGEIDSQVTDDSEFIEHLRDNGRHRGLIAIAPHGGKIEPHTDAQAECVGERLASKCVSVWVCKGFKKGGGAFERWHITSIDISEDSFPRLNEVIQRGFEYAVAFHGWNEDKICIGGSAPLELKKEIKTAIQGVTSKIDVFTDEEAGCPADFNGNHPKNVVNRLAVNGIQIEQSESARKKYGVKIANAVADVLGPKIKVCTAPVFAGSEFWTCLMEGLSDSVQAISRDGIASMQCESKRLQFRIQNCIQGNSDPGIEL